MAATGVLKPEFLAVKAAEEGKQSQRSRGTKRAPKRDLLQFQMMLAEDVYQPTLVMQVTGSHPQKEGRSVSLSTTKENYIEM